MKKKFAISMASSGVKDMQELKAWYLGQSVPDVGESLVGELISRIETLADFPESGRIVPEIGIARVREIIHPPFRVVYRLEESRVRIIRVWRSERLLTIP